MPTATPPARGIGRTCTLRVGRLVEDPPPPRDARDLGRQQNASTERKQEDGDHAAHRSPHPRGGEPDRRSDSGVVRPSRRPPRRAARRRCARRRAHPRAPARAPPRRLAPRLGESRRRCRAASCRPARWCPRAMVTGRSVFSRRVTHGTPSAVVSSWMPPESVSTKRAAASPAASRSRTAARPRGGRASGAALGARQPEQPDAEPERFDARRVRGCSGRRTGVSAAIAAERVEDLAQRLALIDVRRAGAACRGRRRPARSPRSGSRADVACARRGSAAANRSSGCRRSGCGRRERPRRASWRRHRGRW